MTSTSQSKRGFTLTEVMVALFIGMMAMAGFLTVFISFLSSSEAATVWRDADYNASMALERMARGTDATTGLRQFHLADIIVVSDGGDWTITDDQTAEGFTYSTADQTISDLAGNIFINNVVDSSISFSQNRLTLSVAISSREGKYETTREFNTTIQPRN
ncbi:prepilin-type N-terminal cleavage/methylation domain-containing protein [Pontiellaceae bacterium B1224]|nr:prepilin-type N-terminal cleavage/methylation domain-containing protein [Pontiellaceae bacterium B1224]